MSGCRWVTPWWISGSLRPFLCSSSVYSCHFLISSSIRSLSFVLYHACPCMKNWYLQFPWRNLLSSPLYFFPKKAFLSPCYSLELYFQLGVSFLSFLFSQLFVRLPQTGCLPSCISFSFGWSWPLPPVQCYEPLIIVLQALSLPDLTSWFYLSSPLYNRKAFDLGSIWMA